MDQLLNVNIAEFCEQHFIKRMWLYGSAIREDFRDDSDIDLLVEFEQGHDTWIALCEAQADLQQMLDSEVDVRTPEAFSLAVRRYVMNSASQIYPREH
jgi:predicted nucleotidyltransferase